VWPAAIIVTPIFKQLKKSTVEVHEALKYVRAAQALGSRETLELYDLEQSKRLAREGQWRTHRGILELRELLEDAVFVADNYKTTLVLPPAPANEDVRALRILRRLKTGLELDADNITRNSSRC